MFHLSFVAQAVNGRWQTDHIRSRDVESELGVLSCVVDCTVRCPNQYSASSNVLDTMRKSSGKLKY